MYAILAARKPEPGERVDDKAFYGLFGVFMTLEEARLRAATLNEKGGYRDVRICEMKEVK